MKTEETEFLKAVNNQTSISSDSKCVDCEAVKKACAFVRQLKAELDKAKEIKDRYYWDLREALDKHRWTPVGEGLPEESDNYLVCDFTDWNRPVFVVSWFVGDKKLFNYSQATHWMFIPKLPDQALKENS